MASIPESLRRRIEQLEARAGINDRCVLVVDPAALADRRSTADGALLIVTGVPIVDPSEVA
jgi:hypothetical protein